MQGPQGYGRQESHLAALKFFRPPVLEDTICDLVPNLTNGDCYGAIVILRSNSKMYQRDSTHWKELGTGSGYLRYTDTALMLNPYLRKTDTAGLLRQIPTLHQVAGMGNITSNAISINGSGNAPSPANGLQLSYNSGGRIEAANPSTGVPTPFTIGASTVYMDDAVIGPLTTTGNAKFTGNGTPGVGKIPLGTDGTGNWIWNGSIWDSTSVKNNMPIDTVKDITSLQAYAGKAKIVMVKDTLRGGVFSWTSTGADNGGTVFAGNGGYWTRSGVSGVYNVKWWGAKGDYNLTTGTNDATAITACINYLASIKTSYFTNTSYRPTLFFPNSNYYLISSPITIPAGINVMGDGEIAYNGSSSSGAVTIGTAGEANNRTSITIKLRQRSIPTWVEPQLTNNYGVKIINAQNCTINIPYVVGFCNNIIFEGDNTGGSTGGFSYNDIFIGSSIDAVKHLTLNCTGTTGWVNENKFNAGNFQNSSSTGTRQESRYGIVIRTTSSFIPNNNVFYKPCFQLNYSSLPDKVADSTIAVFIEKGNINNFYDIRSENSGPILMVTKDLSFGNYAYTNIFGADNKDQLVDLSTSRNNYVISDLAKYSGPISGATQIFNSGFLPDKINKYDASTYYIPGVSWARVADANVYPSGGEVGLSNGYITLTENYKMGVFVDTRVAKKFAIKWDVIDEKGGRIFVRLYDKNGIKITPTSSLISPSALSGNIVSTFGGGYITGSDNTGRYFNFGVDTSVKSIFIAVSGGTDSLKIKSWQLYSLDNLAASIYTGLKNPFINSGIAAIAPTEVKAKGTLIYNDLSSTSAPFAWQNTDGATTWKVIDWAPVYGSTNYVNINPSNPPQIGSFNISDTATVTKTGADTFNPYFRLQTGLKGAAIQMGDPTASESTLQFWTTNVGAGPGANNYAERMRITPSGVSIGTTSKLSALTVGAFGGFTGITSTGASGGSINTLGSGYLTTGASTGGLFLGSNNVGAAVVTTAQIVGVAPANWSAGTSYPTYMAFSTTQAGSITSAERMRITDSGNVAINKTTAAAKLDVNGDVAAVHYIGNSATPTFTPTGSANSILGTGYTFTISGNDAHMYITITTGTGITTSGTIGDIVFNTPYSTPPVVVWSTGNINALANNVVGFNGTLAASIAVFSSAVLAPSTTYNYNIITGK